MDTCNSMCTARLCLGHDGVWRLPAHARNGVSATAATVSPPNSLPSATMARGYLLALTYTPIVETSTMILPSPGPRQRRHARSSAFAALAALTLVACDAKDPLAPGGLRAPGTVARAQNVVPNVAVYVSAHQDDWQLFVGDQFAAHAQGTTQKVVAIYTTAGDGNRGTAYWNTRETASRRSVDTLIGPGAWSCGTQTVNAHPIHRCVKGKVVSYYMRLPDGNLHGDGYGAGSLKLLQGGRATAAINGSTTYTSWADFTGTLRAIIAAEAGGNTSPLLHVNVHEHDRAINVGDHDDHLRTGDAVRDAAQGQPWDVGYFIGYQTRYMPENVTGTPWSLKRAEFWQYTETMANAGYGTLWWEPEYQAWLRRTYVRYVNYVPPAPPAAPSNLAASATYSRVTLTWSDNSSDEGLFRLQRAPDVAGAPGAWADAATPAANSTSFIDATVAPSTSYWYRLRAESNGGTSAYTAAAAVTTGPLPPPPATPGNLQGTGVSGSRIDITWTDVANETSYELQRAPDVNGAAGTYAAVATLAADATSYMDLGLQPNTRYWYRLRALGDGGISAYATVSASTSASFQTDVWVVAAQDDWQLFMGDRTNASLQSAQRVVFIYTTAGDQNQNMTYWLTREAAARASVDTLIGAGAWSCAPRAVGTRSIQRCEKGKVIAYYMRMPDGFWGDGFGTNGSMNNLKFYGQATTTRDGSTTYTSWADFTGTLRSIIVTETGGQSAPYVQVHSPDHSTTANPNDMPDRYRTGEAVLAASQGLRWDSWWYVGKNSQNMTANVTGAAYDVKVRAYRAGDNVMFRGGYGSGWWEVQGWLPRTYYRFVAAP